MYKTIEDVLDTNPEHALDIVMDALRCTNLQPLVVAQEVGLPEGAGRVLDIKREDIHYLQREELMKHPNLHIVNHPMLQHKLSILRQDETGPQLCWDLGQEITSLLMYGATQNLPTKPIDLVTPVCAAPGYGMEIDGKKPVLTIIMRAAIGMYYSARSWLPLSKTATLGIYRDPVTKLPKINYVKVPQPSELREIFILDPMLATGVSAVTATEIMKAFGCKKITFISIISAPQGVNAMLLAHPDVEIYTAALDPGLTTNRYIVPGLGDAGDKFLGTF